MAKIGDVLVQLKSDTRGFQRGMSSARKNLRRFGLAIGAVVAAGTAFAVALSKLTKRGGEFSNAQRAFVRITKGSVGALRRLQEDTRGLISSYDLMIGLNRAVTLGAAENAEQFGELAKTAITLGRALGVNAKFAVESLSLGIGRQSRLILDNLGIIVKVEQANKDYAKALGIATSELTDLQKREAFRAAALKAARDATQELGGITTNAADKLKEFGVQLINIRDRIAEIVANSPIFLGILDKISQAVGLGGEAFRKERDAIEALGADVDELTAKKGELETKVINLSFALTRNRAKLEEAEGSFGFTGVKVGELTTLVKEQEEKLGDLARAYSLANRRLLQFSKAAEDAAAPVERLIPDFEGPLAVALAEANTFIRALEAGWVRATEASDQFAREAERRFREIGQTFAEQFKQMGVTAGGSLIAGLIAGIDTGSAALNRALTALGRGIQGAATGFIFGGPIGGLIGGIGGLVGGLFGQPALMRAPVGASGPSINVHMPSGINPILAARDTQWLELWREAALANEALGFRVVRG